jgi:CheY-like chemotaxis protein
MEMSQETRLGCPKEDPKYKKPSERAAKFVLAIVGFFKDMFTAPTAVIPRGRVVQHEGQVLSGGKKLHYPHILIVEDIPARAEEFIEITKNYYVFGSVKIFIAHAYDAAVTFFTNEDIDLVIMDVDLDDEEGDGANLTQKFLTEKPDLAILANSSKRISNLKLTGLGAIESLGKKAEKLREWLSKNDPVGFNG